MSEHILKDEAQGNSLRTRRQKNAVRFGVIALTVLGTIGAKDSGCVSVQTNGTSGEGVSRASTCSAGAPKVSRFMSEYNKLPHHTCPEQAQKIAKAIIMERWHSTAEWEALDWLIGEESSWLADNIEDDAINGPATGACGLVQALPCSKLYKDDFNHDGIIEVNEQIEWDVSYILHNKNFHDPIGAEAFHKAKGWY